MNFLYPQFLFGLLALAIPVLVHLFNFRRTKRIYFSNTQFLQLVEESSSAKRKLKHFLVLFSRLLFLFSLVVAFAQPYIPATEQGFNREVVIYLDNSWSMSNEAEPEQTGLDAGVGYINELAEIYPPNTRYRLITNDFAPFSNTLKSKEELLEITTELSYSGVKRTFDNVLSRINTYEDSDGLARDIYWISDFQKSTVGSLGQLVIDSLTEINLVPISFPKTSNVYVDSIYLENPFLIGTNNLKLNVLMRNSGSENVNDLVIRAFIDEVQSATTSVDIEGGSEAKIVFDLVTGKEKVTKGLISFEDFPVTFDNDFYFTLTTGDKIAILEIKENGSPQTVIETVFGNPTLFDFQSFEQGNLDYSLVERVELVILNGLENIDPSLAIALNRYLEKQGSILLVPGRSPNIASYQSIVRRYTLSLSDTSAMTDFEAPDFNDPFYDNVFEERNEGMSMPSAYSLVNWGLDRTALLKFKNGVPFLSKLFREGNLYLMSTPLFDRYTTFHQHAIFVPVMYRLAELSASKDSRLFHELGENVVTVKVDSLNRDEIVKLTNESREMIPLQRQIDGELQLQLPNQTLEAGFYNIDHQGETRHILGFNYSREESKPDQYGGEELEGIFEGQNIKAFDLEGKTFSSTVKERYLGVPLWKYALFLALLFLLAEVMLIRFLK